MLPLSLSIYLRVDLRVELCDTPGMLLLLIVALLLLLEVLAALLLRLFSCLLALEALGRWALVTFVGAAMPIRAGEVHEECTFHLRVVV